jgi:signal peptidase II
MLATLMADQVTKGLIVFTLSPGQSMPDSGLFRLTYVTNSGSAFGLFPNQTLFLILASFVGIGILLLFYCTRPISSTMLRLSLGLQLGGAIGNLVDRARLGYVVDFIDVGAWPVFNIADSAIVVGLIGLLWTLMSTKDSNSSESDLSEEGVLLPAVSMDEGLPNSEMETTSVSDNGVSGKRDDQWE